MAEALEILIVDDEPQITELLSSFVQLRFEDSKVHTFNDPCRAKEFMENSNPDILITDYKMPGLDGIQLLKSADASVKKVMISGYMSEITVERLQQLNVTYMEKPVVMKELGKLISEVQNSKKCDQSELNSGPP